MNEKLQERLSAVGLNLKGQQIVADPSEYVEGRTGAGVVFIAATTGRILLGKRSGLVDEPHVWSAFSGIMRAGETAEQTVRREVHEETGYTQDFKMLLAHTYVSKDRDFTFYNYIAVVPYEFPPNLNWEHKEAAWFSLVWLPSPMHYGLKDMLANSMDLLQSAKETLFVDRPVEHRNRMRGI